MELSSPNNYKIMILHWIQNATQIIPLHHYSLALNTASYYTNPEKSHSPRNILHSAYLDIKDTGLFNLTCDTWRENPTSAKNWSNFKLLCTKDASKIKHHNTGSVELNYEAANDILQLSDEFTAQQQEIANMRNL